MPPYTPRKDGKFQPLHLRHWPPLYQVMIGLSIIILVVVGTHELRKQPMRLVPMDEVRFSALETTVTKQQIQLKASEDSFAYRIDKIETDALAFRNATNELVSGMMQDVGKRLARDEALITANHDEAKAQFVVTESRWREVMDELQDFRPQTSPRVVIIRAEARRAVMKKPVPAKLPENCWGTRWSGCR